MTEPYDIVVHGGTVVTPGGTFRGDIAIRGERIAAIGRSLAGRRELDATGKLVLPGVIDGHTHMAAPAGGATSADDFLTGSRAAAAGGVTTLVDFTTASEGSSLSEDIERRRRDAVCAVIDVALHAEIIDWSAGREREIEAAVEDGVSTFKFYMAYGSLGQRSDTGALYHAFQAIAEAGGVAMVHAEDDPIIEEILRRMDADEKVAMTSLPRSRPPICEGAAITQAVYLAEKTGARLHVCHVTSALGVEALARARRAGVRVTGETCPQYLLLTEDVYTRDDAAQFSVMPPLRSAPDRASLWAGLQGGVLSCVATDHCPFRRDQKRLDRSFEDLPYGLPGVETLLPILYSEGVGSGRLELPDLARLLSEEPARIFDLEPQKGILAIGADADIAILDSDAEWTITADVLHMNTDFSPFEGLVVRGKVTATLSRGVLVYTDGEIAGEPGRGRFVRSRRPKK